MRLPLSLHSTAPSFEYPDETTPVSVACAMWTVPVILCFNASFVIASDTASARNCDIVSVPTPEAPTPPAIARTVGPAPERNAPCAPAAGGVRRR